MESTPPNGFAGTSVTARVGQHALRKESPALAARPRVSSDQADALLFCSEPSDHKTAPATFAGPKAAVKTVCGPTPLETSKQVLSLPVGTLDDANEESSRASQITLDWTEPRA